MSEPVRTYPDNLDAVDRAMVDSLLPPDRSIIVTEMMTVVAWMDEDGRQAWRLHVAHASSVAVGVGLLDLAKLRLVAEGAPSLLRPAED